MRLLSAPTAHVAEIVTATCPEHVTQQSSNLHSPCEMRHGHVPRTLTGRHEALREELISMPTRQLADDKSKLPAPTYGAGTRWSSRKIASSPRLFQGTIWSQTSQRSLEIFAVSF
jgi:hypothetical protein